MRFGAIGKVLATLDVAPKATPRWRPPMTSRRLPFA
jgi:hypothetical protein